MNRQALEVLVADAIAAGILEVCPNCGVTVGDRAAHARYHAALQNLEDLLQRLEAQQQ